MDRYKLKKFQKKAKISIEFNLKNHCSIQITIEKSMRNLMNLSKIMDNSLRKGRLGYKNRYTREEPTQDYGESQL